MQLLRISKIPRLNATDTSLYASGCNGRKLHDFDSDLTYTHSSRRNIYYAQDSGKDTFNSAILCTYLGFQRSPDWKFDCVTSLNARRYNIRKLHNIDNDLTSTHLLHKCVQREWHPSGHFKEGDNMQLLRISKIPRLKMRLCHIAKRETMPWKKTTWYRHWSHIDALFT